MCPWASPPHTRYGGVFKDGELLLYFVSALGAGIDFFLKLLTQAFQEIVEERIVCV